MSIKQMAVLALLAMSCLLAGCREHPRVTSRESLELIKQFYTACNTRNANRLAKCRQEYTQLVSRGVLSTAEQSSFEGILKAADQGKWSTAADASLQFARDQVR